MVGKTLIFSPTFFEHGYLAYYSIKAFQMYNMLSLDNDGVSGPSFTCMKNRNYIEKKNKKLPDI